MIKQTTVAVNQSATWTPNKLDFVYTVIYACKPQVKYFRLMSIDRVRGRGLKSMGYPWGTLLCWGLCTHAINNTSFNVRHQPFIITLIITASIGLKPKIEEPD